MEPKSYGISPIVRVLMVFLPFRGGFSAHQLCWWCADFDIIVALRWKQGLKKQEEKTMKLEGRVAIVTGGRRGLGKQFVLAFAEEGADVVIVDNAQEGMKELAEQVEKMGGKAMWALVDVSNRADVEAMVEKTMKAFGKIDILVNNAATFPAHPFLDIPVEEWLRVIEVDLTGVFHCTQVVAREMVKRKYGRVINITSSQALLGVDLMAHYTAAKGGIISLTRALASELSPLGITVNAISPGLTATDGVLINLPEEFQKDFGGAQAVRRMGRPEEFRGIAVLLASDDGSFITGETIAVDGGMSNVMAPVQRYSGDADVG